VCYSNSSTSSNIELSKHYNRKIPDGFPETIYFYASGFKFPNWRIINSEFEIQNMNWGLVPSWCRSKKEDFAKYTLNCKVETIFDKPSFKKIALTNRCIIPSTGFFEWQQIGKVKVPYFIFHPKGEILSFAGLWDKNIDILTGAEYFSFTIITCEANEYMAQIHNTKKRMPLILGSDISKDDWLSGKTEMKLIVNNTKHLTLSSHQINKKLILSQNSNSSDIQLPYSNIDFKQESLF